MADIFSDYTSPTQEELNQFGRECAEHCRERQAEMEAKWRSQNLTWSWVDTQPKWISCINWDYGDEDGPLQNPTRPCKRTFRLSLIGGGQIRITENWVESCVHELLGVWNSKINLTISAHVDDGARLQIARGKLYPGDYCEMNASAVVLRGAQDIADRAAATLRAITVDENGEVTPPDRDRFYALLDSARGCAICRRSLRDEISKLIGVGPDCARQWKIPHSRDAASKRLALRREILGQY
jgi:hypothetical protein